jgi:hypothetical protein
VGLSFIAGQYVGQLGGPTWELAPGEQALAVDFRQALVVSGEVGEQAVEVRILPAWSEWFRFTSSHPVDLGIFRDGTAFWTGIRGGSEGSVDGGVWTLGPNDTEPTALLPPASTSRYLPDAMTRTLAASPDGTLLASTLSQLPVGTACIVQLIPLTGDVTSFDCPSDEGLLFMTDQVLIFGSATSLRAVDLDGQTLWHTADPSYEANGRLLGKDGRTIIETRQHHSIPYRLYIDAIDVDSGERTAVVDFPDWSADDTLQPALGFQDYGYPERYAVLLPGFDVSDAWLNINLGMAEPVMRVLDLYNGELLAETWPIEPPAP